MNRGTNSTPTYTEHFCPFSLSVAFRSFDKQPTYSTACVGFGAPMNPQPKVVDSQFIHSLKLFHMQTKKPSTVACKDRTAHQLNSQTYFCILYMAWIQTYRSMFCTTMRFVYKLGHKEKKIKKIKMRAFFLTCLFSLKEWGGESELANRQKDA